jgi:hypothetical protein
MYFMYLCESQFRLCLFFYKHSKLLSVLTEHSELGYTFFWNASCAYLQSKTHQNNKDGALLLPNSLKWFRHHGIIKRNEKLRGTSKFFFAMVSRRALNYQPS